MYENQKTQKSMKASKRNYIIFFNETSNQGCINYKVNEIILMDLNNFSILVPEMSCAEGHTINFLIFDSLEDVRKLKMFPSTIPTKICTSIVGKITYLEIDPSRNYEIKVNVGASSLTTWTKYIRTYEDRQLNVSDLFDKFQE